MRPSLLFTLGVTVLLSSCSCAIRHEHWKVVGRSSPSDESALWGSALACGFRRNGDVMKKHDYDLRIDEDGRWVGLRSSWCPFPHRLISMKPHIAAWSERGDRMRDAFLDETRKRGLHLEKQEYRCEIPLPEHP